MLDAFNYINNVLNSQTSDIKLVKTASLIVHLTVQIRTIKTIVCLLLVEATPDVLDLLLELQHLNITRCSHTQKAVDPHKQCHDSTLTAKLVIYMHFTVNEVTPAKTTCIFRPTQCGWQILWRCLW